MAVASDGVLAEIEALYAARFGHFLRVARAVVGDRERALEAVQDGFADVIRGRNGFRRDGPLEAWVWRSVLNAAHKAARLPLVEASFGVEGTLEASASGHELAPLVAALPERQRLVVFLRYYADLAYRAIAPALEVEVGTVSATLAAAHAAIRKSIEEVQSNG